MADMDFEVPTADWSATGSILDMLTGDINPPALAPRFQALKAYREVYDDKWARWTEEALGIKLGWVQGTCVGVADLAVIDPPTALGESYSNEMHDVLVAMGRDGGAIVWFDPYDGVLRVLDAMEARPADEGWLYVEPQSETTSGISGTAIVTVILNTGDCFRTLYDWSPTRLGNPLGPTQANASLPPAIATRGTTRQESWGTPLCESAFSLALEANRRLTSLSDYLDAQQTPNATVRMKEGAQRTLGDTTAPEAKQITIATNASKVLSEYYAGLGKPDRKTLILPNSVQEVGAVVWNAQPDISLMLYHEMQRNFEHVSGTPGILSGLERAGMAGIALKRLLLPLYTTVLDMPDSGKFAASLALGTEVVSEHPFDVLENAATASPGTVPQPGGEEPML